MTNGGASSGQRGERRLAQHKILVAGGAGTAAGTGNDVALVEFTMLVGHYAMLAGLLNAAKVPREEGVAGFPDGRR